MAKNKHTSYFDRYPRNRSLSDKANRRRFIRLYQKNGGVYYKSLSNETLMDRLIELADKKYNDYMNKQ